MNLFIKKSLALCLIIIPIVLFWYTFHKYAINIPHWDDFAVRNSLANFLDASTFIEKIKSLFEQHNEHRILLTRLFALIVFQLKGFLDLKALMVIGNLGLMGILWVFYKTILKNNLNLLALAPLSFLIFNLGLYENTFWGMASVQNFWVIFLAFLCFYLLVYSYHKFSKSYFYLAVFICFLGTFSSSNGLLIPLIGLAILSFQRRKTELIIWSIASVMIFSLYFFHYYKPLDNAAKVDLSDISLLFKGLLAVLGNAVDVSFIAPAKHLDIAMATGVILIIFIVMFAYHVLIKKYNIDKRNNDLFLLGCLTFLGITCVGIALGRLSYGIETLLTSKYKINSLLIIVIFYLAALNSLAGITQKNFIIGAIVVAVVFNLYTNLSDYQNLKYLRNERITDQFKIYHSDKDMPTKGTLAILQRPAKAFYDDIMPILSQVRDTVKTNITIEENEAGFILKEDRKETKLDLNFPDAGQYFIIKSADNIYLFPSRTVAASKKSYLTKDFLIDNQLRLGSFVADFTKFYIQSGKYQLGKVSVEKGQSIVTWTNQTIDIQSVRKEKPKQNW